MSNFFYLHVFKKAAFFISTALLLCSTGCIAITSNPVETNINAIKSGTYQLDKHHASVFFKVQHMGLSHFVGRFNQFDATLKYDPKNPQKTQFSATIKTASLDINHPSFADELKGKGWFDQEHSPQISFQSTSILWHDQNHATVTGNMTLLDVTAPIDMDVTFIGAARHTITQTYTLGFSAIMKIHRSTFGLDKFIPVVADEVNIEIDAEFQLK